LEGFTPGADPQVVAIGDENEVMRWTLPHLTAFAAVSAALLLGSSWLHAADAERMQQAAQRQGVKAVAGVKALQTLMLAVSDLDEDGRLQAVNQFFNRRIQFRDDLEVWGLADYWASPLELLEKGQGDCEDYVIAKYFSLLSLGVPSAKLRLVYVRALLGGAGGTVQAHMVLAYYPTAPSLTALQAEPLILDNLVSDIRPASRRPDLTPVFSFNSDGLWQGVNGAPDGDPLVRLSRWREVISKARTEGFL
jgi:predicted transglutaminase-like cysteine proteinase